MFHANFTISEVPHTAGSDRIKNESFQTFIVAFTQRRQVFLLGRECSSRNDLLMSNEERIFGLKESRTDTARV